MKEHSWVANDTHPYWEQRRCSVCHLEDLRIWPERQERDDCTSNHWREKRGCIEPVPDSITYEDLLAEMSAAELRQGAGRFLLMPHAQGRPGQWTVSFASSAPHLTVATLEEGWAELLRWLRVRGFDQSEVRNRIAADQRAESERCNDDD